MNFLNRLTKNGGLKIASVLSAFILWFLIVQIQNPQDVATFGNIQVKITNTDVLESEGKVYEILEGSDIVRVTVRAPKSIVRELRATDIIAEADMSRLTDINTIPITYSVQNVDSSSIGVSGNRDVVKLSVETGISKYVRVRSNIIGTVAEGYVLGNVSLSQNLIQISGPESIIDNVNEAQVDITVDNATSSLNANFEIKLLDASGDIINDDNIRKQSNYVPATVEILGTKELPVRAEYSGTPASGYAATGEVIAEPETVTVAGHSTVLSGITEIVIPEGNIDITGATGDVVSTVDISQYISNSLRVTDSSEVNVRVRVESIERRNIDIATDNISFVNLPENMEAVIMDSAEYHQITVEGFKELLDATDASGLKGTVDVKKWMDTQELDELRPGYYYMNVDVALPEGVSMTGYLILHTQIKRMEN
ncbi:MAG: hypothetical protein IJ608_09960 [Lachnospiraceae bacterium]|nr:hypothetical protein [Lachnospiraceae bacterium]